MNKKVIKINVECVLIDNIIYVMMFTRASISLVEAVFISANNKIHLSINYLTKLLIYIIDITIIRILFSSFVFLIV